MRPPLLLCIARFYSIEFVTYPLESLAIIIRRFFTVGLLLFFWYLVEQDNAVTDVQVVPYILIAAGVQYISVGHFFKQANIIHKDIKDGSLSSKLLLPYSVLRYQFGVYLGTNVFDIVFSCVNIVVGIVLLDGELSVQCIGLFAVALVPACIIGYALNVLVAAMGFWLTEASYLRMVGYFVLRIVSGLFVPLTFFGDVLGRVLALLPFAQFAFVPSFILTGDGTLAQGAQYVLAGAVWSVVMVAVALHVWRQGIKHYSAVGL